MKAADYKRSLSLAAKACRSSLLENSEGTPLKMEKALWSTPTDTAGWAFPLAQVGRGGPWIDIWLDYYTGHDVPTFWYGFSSDYPEPLRPIIRSTPKELRAEWKLVDSDVEPEGKATRLVTPLRRNEFNKAVEEQYPEWGSHYFGVYEKVRDFGEQSMNRLGCRAAALIQDIVENLPASKPRTDWQNAYPQVENRKKVQSHLHRERSATLSLACKERDKFRCTICRVSAKSFAGHGVATLESHHKVSLGSLRSTVLTRLEDLITVCANCHKMLHRMTGKPDDIDKLRRIVRQTRR